MSVPTDNNISFKECKRINTKPVIRHLKKMQHLKTNNVQLIEGALGMIKKVTNKHINKILSSPNRYEIQKITPYGTGHIRRRVLLMSVENKDQKRYKKKHKYIESK